MSNYWGGMARVEGTQEQLASLMEEVALADGSGIDCDKLMGSNQGECFIRVASSGHGYIHFNTSVRSDYPGFLYEALEGHGLTVLAMDHLEGGPDDEFTTWGPTQEVALHFRMSRTCWDEEVADDAEDYWREVVEVSPPANVA